MHASDPGINVPLLRDRLDLDTRSQSKPWRIVCLLLCGAARFEIDSVDSLVLFGRSRTSNHYESEPSQPGDIESGCANIRTCPNLKVLFLISCSSIRRPWTGDLFLTLSKSSNVLTRVLVSFLSEFKVRLWILDIVFILTCIATCFGIYYSPPFQHIVLITSSRYKDYD